jgi:hypothetical protein
MSIAAVSSVSIFPELQSLNQNHQTDVKQLDKVLRKGDSGDPFGPPVLQGAPPEPARFIGPPVLQGAPPEPARFIGPPVLQGASPEPARFIGPPVLQGAPPEPARFIGPPVAEQVTVKQQNDYELVLNLFNSASTNQAQTNSSNALSVNA